MWCRKDGRTREYPQNYQRGFKKKRLAGKTALVSAGPTYEAIDPVRFIGNHSSGLMGFCIAEELAKEGATVNLVAGPTSLTISDASILRHDIVSANEMYGSCTELFPKSDITVMSAAIADYTPENKAERKIKKEDDFPVIKLKPTKDVLLELGKLKSENQVLVGFALETDNELSNAQKKLQRKNLDFIVLNSLQDKGAGFGTQTNKISIVDKNNIQQFELKTKQEVAKDIVNRIIEMFK